MSRNLQIGSKVFEIPDAGDEAGWGEDTTEFLVAVSAALETVQGPNDILLTSAILANNQTVAANIPGLILNIGVSQGAVIDFTIERIYTLGTTTVSEYGQILCSYDGTQLDISIDSDNDTGVLIDATNTGQFTYTSSNLTDHVSTTVRFKLKSIDR